MPPKLGRQRIIKSAHDPNFKRRTQSQDLLLDSTRCALADMLPEWLADESTSTQALLLAGRLLCDASLPVRDRMAAALSDATPALQQLLYDQLMASVEEWPQACAIEAIGYWDIGAEAIASARQAEAPLIRRRADAAFERQQTRATLSVLEERFLMSDGRSRIAAFYALCDHGTAETAQRLLRSTTDDAVLECVVAEIEKVIEEHERKRLEERVKEEQELADAPGRIRFS